MDLGQPIQVGPATGSQLNQAAHPTSAPVVAPPSQAVPPQSSLVQPTVPGAPSTAAPSSEQAVKEGLTTTTHAPTAVIDPLVPSSESAPTALPTNPATSPQEQHRAVANEHPAVVAREVEKTKAAERDVKGEAAMGTIVSGLEDDRLYQMLRRFDVVSSAVANHYEAISLPIHLGLANNPCPPPRTQAASPRARLATLAATQPPLAFRNLEVQPRESLCCCRTFVNPRFERAETPDVVVTGGAIQDRSILYFVLHLLDLRLRSRWSLRLFRRLGLFP